MRPCSKSIRNILEKLVLKNISRKYGEIEAVKDFKRILTAQDSWTKGSPKGVNKLTYYGDLESKSATGRANMPGHVRAALNWNTMRRMNGDNYSLQIVDGMKVIVCKVKENPLGFTSVAYQVDELRLPKWFQDLPFDHSEMEATIINNKLDNLIGVLEWDLDSTTQDNTFGKLFSFD